MPTLSQFPAEVVYQLQQQQRDTQEQEQAEEQRGKTAACLSVRLSEEQSQISPGATQHLHTAAAWEKARVGVRVGNAAQEAVMRWFVGQGVRAIWLNLAD